MKSFFFFQVLFLSFFLKIWYLSTFFVPSHRLSCSQSLSVRLSFHVGLLWYDVTVKARKFKPLSLPWQTVEDTTLAQQCFCINLTDQPYFFETVSISELHFCISCYWQSFVCSRRSVSKHLSWDYFDLNILWKISWNQQRSIKSNH